jgi:hypothetical protein
VGPTDPQRKTAMFTTQQEEKREEKKNNKMKIMRIVKRVKEKRKG